MTDQQHPEDRPQDDSDPQNTPSEFNIPGHPVVRQYRGKSLGARLPESVANGELATSVLVQQGPDVYVIDFLQQMRPPWRIVGRVVLTPMVMGQLVETLQGSLDQYTQRFGPPWTPKPLDQPEQAHDTANDMTSSREPTSPASPAAPASGASAGGQGGTANASGGDGWLYGDANMPDDQSGLGRPSEDAAPVGAVEDLYGDYKISDEMLGGAYANIVMISHTPQEFCLDFVARFAPTPVVTARLFLTVPNAVRMLQTIRQAFRHRKNGGGQTPPAE